MAGETASDEIIANSIHNFKIKTYITVLDILITQISERFNENITPIYKDIFLFQKKHLKGVEKLNSNLPLDAFNAFDSVQLKFLEKNIRNFVMHILVLKIL